jgi:pilus assembly protein CpaB
VSVSIRTIATFAGAIFFGLVAVYFARVFLQSQQRAVVQPAAIAGSVPVVVASQPLARGVVLDARFLKLVNFPADSVPTNSFHSIAEVVGSTKDQQRLSLRPLVANEPILAANVSGPGGKLNLAGTVAAGMRAVSLRSSDVTGVGGFVLPGDRVDVLLTRAVNGNSNAQNNSVTQVLAENVRVLGVDQSDNDQADKPVVTKAITVEVTPDQAESISLGATIGILSLSLRHVADDTPLTRKVMAVSDLGGGPRRASGGATAAPAIRVFRGTEATRFSLSVADGLERAAARVPAGVRTP